MTLAVILVGISLAASVPPLPVATAGQDTSQAAPASKTSPTSNVQNQASTPAAQSSSTPSKPATIGAGQTPPTQSHSVAKHPRHKKKSARSNCNPTPAMAQDPTASGSAASGSEPTKTSGDGTSSTATGVNAPINCPPSKIIVRQGGASEPAIRLAGGPAGDQATQQQNTANQMLAGAEQNLKTIAGRALTANQQDMVNQVRQFMEQAKAASAAGDVDRARTLAWKAQLLSEELVSPEKK